MDEFCEVCGELLYHDCMGDVRCEVCDPPCPYCDDGGYEVDEDDDEEEPLFCYDEDGEFDYEDYNRD
jgi:hypothetical protein